MINEQNITELLGKDDLRGVLESLSAFCLETGKEDFEMDIKTDLGRLARIESDRRNGLLSVSESYENLNQVRIAILDLVKKVIDYDTESKITPVLEEQIEKTDKLLIQNRKVDLIYKAILFIILFIGLGIMIYTILSEKGLYEKVYLGSLSICGIFSSLYFYTKLRSIEVFKYANN